MSRTSFVSLGILAGSVTTSMIANTGVWSWQALAAYVLGITPVTLWAYRSDRSVGRIAYRLVGDTNVRRTSANRDPLDRPVSGRADW